MPTPYDNHDPGYSREERRTAAQHGVDLDAPEQVRCDDCGKLFDDLNDAGKCQTCASECTFCNHKRGSKKCCGMVEVEFLTAPTLAGCLSLMGAKC